MCRSVVPPLSHLLFSVVLCSLAHSLHFVSVRGLSGARSPHFVSVRCQSGAQSLHFVSVYSSSWAQSNTHSCPRSLCVHMWDSPPGSLHCEVVEASIWVWFVK